MTKRILSFILVLVISIGVVPAMQLKASAAPAYDVDAAIKYAQANWNSGVGLCADFVSECLKAGGVDVFEPRVINLYNALVSKGYGTSYVLTYIGVRYEVAASSHPNQFTAPISSGYWLRT